MGQLKLNDFSITAIDPKQSDYLESIFYHGNGYMGARGFACEDTSIRPHQKGIYMAGMFDFLKDGITDMVNTPDFLGLRVLFGNGDKENGSFTISDFSQSLDLHDGVFSREYLMQGGDQTLHVRISRFFSLHDVHVVGVRLEITPTNFSGLVSCIASIDTISCNLPVNDDQVKKNNQCVNYMDILFKTPLEKGCLAVLETKSTKIGLAEAFAIQCSSNISHTSTYYSDSDGRISRIDTFNVHKGETYCIDKLISVFTSRDIDKPLIKNYTIEKLNACCEKGYERLLEENRSEWKNRWETADIEISGDPKAQCGVRYNIFQLICNNSQDDDHVSIGARGLTHPRYKGCYFWDTEIFMLPFFIHTNPTAAKNLLKYRYNSLPSAREHSRRMNTSGARFPWMTSFDGSEQCESWDTGACEMHITCDVAYAFDHYIRVSGDLSFLYDYAAEVYIETARFWASRFTYDPDKDRYNLLFTKGPDEYCGVTHNNTYTIYLSIYNFQLALLTTEHMKKACPACLDELYRKIGFDSDEIEKWLDIIKKTEINYDDSKKLFIEDDTFMLLEPLKISDYKKDNTPLYHQICFDRLQRYRVLKQADVILLMTLFPSHFTDEQKNAAWEFYEPLTLHDSTLSFGTHALLGAQINKMDKAWDYLTKSLYLDLDNIMGNTGSEGLHVASLGATWQAVILGFAGVSFSNGVIDVNPRLPETWDHLKFTLLIQGKKVSFSINKDNWDMKILE
ncbi:MAG: glycoside hydrolase family 65 protein [Clostridia bacterium]|nr:glycoside hydrolase family 65 protein [Clostridia bacterium]